VHSNIPTVDAQIEHTGSISNFPGIAEEGNIITTEATNADTNDNDSLPDLLHPDDDSSTSSSEADLDQEFEDELDDEMETTNKFVDDDISPQPLPTLQRSTRV
jgi:hypothetical protein